MVQHQRHETEAHRLTKPQTLVLFSGGLESTVLLAWAVRRGPVAVLTAEFPDRPAGERRAAQRILRHFKIKQRHRVPFPDGADAWAQGGSHRNYIPARNLFLQAAAVLVARRIGATETAAGHTRQDAESFRDARRRYLDAVERLANQARAPGEPRLWILTPFSRWQKSDVARLGRRLGAPIEKSWSCYRDGARPCGRCVACRERENALKASGTRPGPRGRGPGAA